jgi:hypothetical protein
MTVKALQVHIGQARTEIGIGVVTVAPVTISRPGHQLCVMRVMAIMTGCLMEGQPVLDYCVDIVASVAIVLKLRVPAVRFMAAGARTMLFGQRHACYDFSFFLVALGALRIS